MAIAVAIRTLDGCLSSGFFGFVGFFQYFSRVCLPMDPEAEIGGLVKRRVVLDAVDVNSNADLAVSCITSIHL
jgi:hypothetical protein